MAIDAYGLDIETLSTHKNAVVLSVGICLCDSTAEQPFDEIVGTGIELFFDRDCQIEAGRHVRNDTLRWWNEQGDAARRVLDVPDDQLIHPRDFYKHFYAFLESHGINQLHAHKNFKWIVRGPHFDIAIMDSLFEDFNITSPWKYWNVRDIRTWLDAKGLPDNTKLVKPDSMIPHNALHDAAFDVYMLQQLEHHAISDLQLDV